MTTVDRPIAYGRRTCSPALVQVLDGEGVGTAGGAGVTGGGLGGTTGGTGAGGGGNCRSRSYHSGRSCHRSRSSCQPCSMRSWRTAWAAATRAAPTHPVRQEPARNAPTSARANLPDESRLAGRSATGSSAVVPGSSVIPPSWGRSVARSGGVARWPGIQCLVWRDATSVTATASRRRAVRGRVPHRVCAGEQECGEERDGRQRRRAAAEIAGQARAAGWPGSGRRPRTGP